MILTPKRVGEDAPDAAHCEKNHSHCNFNNDHHNLHSVQNQNRLSQKSKDQFLQEIAGAQGIIHKICHMYCDIEEDRKDLFQEILIQLWQSYPSFRGEAKFTTWMYRIALNVAIQHLRKVKKIDSIVESYNSSGDLRTVELPDMDYKYRTLYLAIGQLSRVEKAIMMLYLEERSNEEIASIVGITQNHVRVKMNRIKKKLKRILKPEANEH